MRITALIPICVASVLANPYPEPDPGGTGMGVLTIWPTARSTALAGTMTGLADEADATYFNPAGLAFQTTARADVTYANWLPDLYPGRYYAFAAGGASLHLPFLHGRSAFVAGNLTYLTVGETDVVDEHGNFLGRVNVWRGAAAVYAAVSLTENLGVGVGLKLLQSAHTFDDWMWDFGPDVGLESGGNATAVAADVALSYRPSSKVSFGLAATNVGPKIRYYPDYDYGDPYSAALPSMVRLGLCWTPIANRNISLGVMPELTKVLVGMFRDTTGTSSTWQQLGDEWKDVWKAVGIEATAFEFVSLRLGYFEDLTSQRGGIVFENEDGATYHYGIWDAFTRKNLGRLERIGLCWGFGLGTDKLRFDFSSDAAIYDFPTQNWRLQLTCNDIGGLFGKRS
jgi:hypothetical protein